MLRRLLPLLLLMAVRATGGDVTGPFPPLPKLPELLAEAKPAVVYQGLPSARGYPDVFKEEVRNHPVFAVAGHHFYAPPLELPDEAQRTLEDQVRAPDFGSRFSGEKLCGGFHADFLLEWERPDKRLILILLCFGCQEWLLIDGDEVLRADLREKSAESLRALLVRHRAYRPDLRRRTKEELRPIPLPPPRFDVKMEPTR